MCGRYTVEQRAEALLHFYKATGQFLWEGSYNIAPSQMVPVVVDGDQAKEIRLMKWGLIPHWAKDDKIGYKMINARGETVAEKPGFRDSFKKRRCIIPATGFFEWRTIAPKKKQPWYFTPKEGLFSFCGLWSRWKSPEGEEIETCAIITTAPNEVVAPIHDRMPVAITDNMIGAWLSNDTKPDDLKDFLAPYPASQMKSVPVSSYVSNVKNHGPRCIEPAAELTASKP